MPPCLTRKDNTYYFRQAVPAELRAILGKREIKKSLGRDYVRAVRDCKRYAVGADGLIADARAQFDNRPVEPFSYEGIRRTRAIPLDRVTHELEAQFGNLMRASLLETDQETEPVGWWMLSTEGKDGLADGKATPGTVFDCRTAQGHLRYLDYELVQLMKEIKSGDKAKRVTTWTWRLLSERYRAWEALLVERAKQRDISGLRQAIDCLRAMPMFSGICVQVKKLIAECNKMLGKLDCPPVVVPELPVMPMIALWDEQRGF